MPTGPSRQGLDRSGNPVALNVARGRTPYSPRLSVDTLSGGCDTWTYEPTGDLVFGSKAWRAARRGGTLILACCGKLARSVPSPLGKGLGPWQQREGLQEVVWKQLSKRLARPHAILSAWTPAESGWPRGLKGLGGNETILGPLLDSRARPTGKARRMQKASQSPSEAGLAGKCARGKGILEDLRAEGAPPRWSLAELVTSPSLPAGQGNG